MLRSGNSDMDVQCNTACTNATDGNLLKEMHSYV